MKYIILLLVVGTVYAIPSKTKAITINGHGRVIPLKFDITQSLVTWYDCSGKADGNYVHPSDCTKFMSCVAEEYAYERNCADCHVEPNNCPTGRLHYDHPRDSCLWAYEAGCVVDGGNQTEPATTEASEPVTTEESEPVTTEASLPVTTEESDPVTTEESEPVTTEESEPVPTTGGPGDGEGEDDSCNPDDCWTEGYCQSYRWCEREASDHKGTGKNGFWLNDTCGDNLYFNPNHNSVHGGVCDFWENLDQATKDKYNNDYSCIDPHCEWKPDPTQDCSAKYWYFHPEQNNGQDQEMNCPQRADGEQLIWDQSKKSCYPCGQVNKANSEEKCC